jgi:hypothetical protein
MTREQSFAASEEHSRIAVMKSLDFEDRRWRKIVEKDSAFDFRLNNGVVDVVS